MTESTVNQDWSDLGSTMAGLGPAAEAKALREAAPVRTFVARLLGAHTDERAWRLGAKGEQLVAAQLDRLGPSWHVLHSIVLSESGTDLDHLVIGPGGVFSVNTNNHPDAKVWVAGDTFMVNGRRQHYVRASRAEARKVSRILTAACGFEVDVRPVIALVNCQVPEVKGQPADVRVCTRRRIVEWLIGQPAVLSAERVETIFAVARRSTSWCHHDRGDGQTEGTAAGRPVHAPTLARPDERRGTPPAGLAPPPAGPVLGGLVIAYSPATGMVLRGDPRPHTKLVSEAGLRWSRPQGVWYLPASRGLPTRADLVGRLADALRSKGFEVSVEVVQ